MGGAKLTGTEEGANYPRGDAAKIFSEKFRFWGPHIINPRSQRGLGTLKTKEYMPNRQILRKSGTKMQNFRAFGPEIGSKNLPFWGGHVGRHGPGGPTLGGAKLTGTEGGANYPGGGQ